MESGHDDILRGIHFGRKPCIYIYIYIYIQGTASSLSKLLFFKVIIASEFIYLCIFTTVFNWRLNVFLFCFFNLILSMLLSSGVTCWKKDPAQCRWSWVQFCISHFCGTTHLVALNMAFPTCWNPTLQSCLWSLRLLILKQWTICNQIFGNVILLIPFPAKLLNKNVLF